MKVFNSEEEITTFTFFLWYMSQLHLILSFTDVSILESHFITS